MLLDEILWPSDQADQAVDALLSHSALQRRHHSGGVAVRELDASVRDLARIQGVEAQPVDVVCRELESYLNNAGPALLSLTVEGKVRLLAHVSARRGRVRVVPPGASVVRLRTRDLLSEITRFAPAPGAPAPDSLVQILGLSAQNAERAAQFMRDRAQADVRVGRAWVLRAPAHGPFQRLLADAGVRRHFWVALAMNLAGVLLMIGGYVGLGRSILNGTQNPAFFLLWAMSQISAVITTVFAYWHQSKVVWSFGQTLKRRFLEGAFRMPLEMFRHQGIGFVLGQVNEADVLAQGNAITVFLLVNSASTLVAAGVLLAYGPAPVLQFGALAACLTMMTLSIRGYLHASNTASTARTRLTQLTTEEMVGHDTRLVQQRAQHWHTAEDPILAEHVAAHQQVDRRGRFLAVVPGIWLVLATLALVPSFLTTGSMVALTAGIVGALFVGQSFQSAQGLVQTLGTNLAAWRQVRPLFDLGGEAEPGRIEIGHVSAAPQAPIVSARDVSASYDERQRKTLDQINVDIRDWDRVLLEGPSGGGKTTLATILAGLRAPSAGRLSIQGLDSRMISSELWRKAVSMSPQFHENHVFSNTVAFNLLLAREWPPTAEDLALAEQICVDLGLGPLLARMPFRLNQLIGETGWRLSHGEQSRIFLARSLLQRSRALILDESLGAMDPETLLACFRCVTTRANALVLIAHP